MNTKNDKVMVNIRIPRAEAERLKRAAKADRRTMTAFILLALQARYEAMREKAS